MELSLHAQRLTEQLDAYWRALRGERAFPREDEVDPDALAAIWKDCFLVDVRHPGRFAYSYLGEALLEAYGDDPTGQEIAENLIYPHPEGLTHAFHAVIRSGQPVGDENEFVNARGLLVKYRCCVLPLGLAQQPGVAYLLGGMKWKIY